MTTPRPRHLALLLLALAPAAGAATFTVGSGGSYATVQAALDAAVPAGGDNDVRIRPGTFTENLTVTLPSGAGTLRVSGGWNPTFEGRALDPSYTVLDGGGAGKVLTVLANGGAFVLENLTVTHGDASAGGAGLRLDAKGASQVRISGVRSVANHAAIDIGSPGQVGLNAWVTDAATLTVEDCVVADNEVEVVDPLQASISSVGMSVYVDTSAQATLVRNVIARNRGSSSDGQVTGAGADIAASDDAVVTFSDNRIEDNVANPDPGSTVYGAGLVLQAYGNGRITARRNIVLRNGTESDQSGEQLALAASGNGSVLLESSLVAAGTGPWTTGLHLLAFDPGSSVAAVNVTVADNPGPALLRTGSTPSFVGNSIFAGNNSEPGDLDPGTDGLNMVGGDPLFADRAAFDYRLTAGSPAIDGGDSSLTLLGTTDLAGGPRVLGNRVDLGAYEFAGGLALQVPSVAHLTGFGGTPWRTGLSLVNTAAEPRDLVLRYRAGGAPVERSTTLPAGAARRWDDVLVDLFGFASGARTGGSLHIDPAGSGVAATSRTYADPGDGTYGQLYPALAYRQAVSPGMVAAVPLVISDDRFYTNIGLQTMSNGPCAAVVTLRDPDGTAIGSPLEVSADGGRWTQINDVLDGLGPHPGAYATVQVTEGSGWVYASVVDRITRDPTTVPVMVRPPSGTVLYVPSVAHLTGFGGIPWKTSLAIVNPGDSPAAVTMIYRAGATILTTSASLYAGQAVVWKDVLVDRFAQAADVRTGGSLEIRATAPVVATSRTYADLGDAGTYGQWYPAVSSADGLTSGVLPLVRKDGLFYTNVGFVNVSSAELTVRVRVFDASGAALGAPVDTPLAPFAWTQVNDVFAEAGAGASSTAYATVEVVSGGGAVWAYASVVDVTTRDPSTVAAVASSP